jgi:hypothetical protein
LMNPGQKYKAISAKIAEFGSAMKITESCWLLRSSQTHTAIRDGLTATGDTNDRFFVGELKGAGAWKNLIPGDAEAKAFYEGK